MEEKINDQRSIKEKVVEFYDNAKRKVILTGSAIGKWCGEHKELVVAISPSLVDSVSRFYVEHGRNKRFKAEQKRINNTVYDSRTGSYYTHKKMNKKQQQEFDYRRYVNKELTADILKDMKILK